jgi:hypothetical protein
MKIPTITLEINGLEELTELLEKANQQIADLKDTIHQINIASLEVNAKRNQSMAATND